MYYGYTRYYEYIYVYKYILSVSYISYILNKEIFNVCQFKSTCMCVCFSKWYFIFEICTQQLVTKVFILTSFCNFFYLNNGLFFIVLAPRVFTYIDSISWLLRAIILITVIQRLLKWLSQSLMILKKTSNFFWRCFKIRTPTENWKFQYFWACLQFCLADSDLILKSSARTLASISQNFVGLLQHFDVI